MNEDRTKSEQRRSRQQRRSNPHSHASPPARCVMTRLAELFKEAITHSMDRQEMPGCSGIRLKLLSKTAHVCIHRPRVGIAIIAPCCVQDYVAGQRAIDILNKEQQKI